MSSDCQDDDELCLWCSKPRHEKICRMNPFYFRTRSCDTEEGCLICGDVCWNQFPDSEMIV